VKLTAIIVDDESPARGLIREYLTEFPDVEVVAECADGETAVTTIDRRRPDLLFLDVRMPGCDGIDVLQRVRAVPLTIFCTAYEQYAVRAFEVSAVDYLLKPYDRARFNRAVERALERFARPEDIAARLTRLAHALQRVRTHPQRLFVRSRGVIVPVEVAAIEWIEAQGDYAQIHAGEAYLAGQSMNALEKLLDPQEFVRVHRSSLVNLRHVCHLRQTDTGSFVVELKSGTALPVSRSRVAHLRKWIV